MTVYVKIAKNMVLLWGLGHNAFRKNTLTGITSGSYCTYITLFQRCRSFYLVELVWLLSDVSNVVGALY